jgi:hypothetical protein
MRTFYLILLMALLSAGCAHKFTQEKVEVSLCKGKTTKQEVLTIFGEPYGKYMSPGMNIVSGGKEHVLHNRVEIWLYSPHQLKLYDYLDSETLRIVFNSDGIVSNFNFQTDGD